MLPKDINNITEPVYKRLKKDIDAVAESVEEVLPDASEASAGNVLQLDSDKKPIWGAPAAGGTKLYKHVVEIPRTPFGSASIILFTDNNSPIVYESIWGTVPTLKIAGTLIAAITSISPSDSNDTYICYKLTQTGSNVYIYGTSVNITSKEITGISTNVLGQAELNPAQLTDTVTEL